jgi:hypothetical protein
MRRAHVLPSTGVRRVKCLLPILVVAAVALPALRAEAGTFTPAASLGTGRSNHSLTLLQNGKLLIAGGHSGSGFLNSAELYDPTTGKRQALTMSSARYYHTATLLRNGKILLAGGLNATGELNAAELFDPVSNSFAPIADTMKDKRFGHSATMLHDGRILLAGGNNGSPTDTLEIFNPSNNTFTLLSTSLSVKRTINAASLLPDGRVLISGGADSFAWNSADIFDPTSGNIATVTMNAGRLAHSSTLLPNGKVLLAGGSTSSAPLASAELFDPATNSFTPVSGTLTVARDRHRATLLPSGVVLITGGGTHGNTPLASTEYYSPASGETGSFTADTSMATARHSHAAVLLPSGKVLVAGGENSGVGSRVDVVELYDPVAVPPTPIPHILMTHDRAAHTSTLLSDGRVLLVGGRYKPATTVISAGSGEIFDPQNGLFSPTTSMSTGRAFHTATLLPSGKVLVTGGVDGSNAYLASAELYDPATGYFHPTGSMTTPRADHRATLLASGKVLITGGTNTETAELYDPVRGTFTLTSGSMSAPRFYHTATLLRNGTVLIVGGIVGTSHHELYDPATDSFRPTGTFVQPRLRHTATLLSSGLVLVTGGEPTSSLPAFVYDPETEQSFEFPMPCQRVRHNALAMSGGYVAVAAGTCDLMELFEPLTRSFTAASRSELKLPNRGATLLTDERILLTGGFANASEAAPLQFAHVLAVNPPAVASRRPQVNPVPATLCQPSPGLSLTGSGFSSDSEGSTGSWQSSAANAPLLRLQSVESEMLHFIRPQTWSRTALSSASITGLPVGWHRLSVVSNGTPSIQQLVLIGNSSSAPSLGFYPAAGVTNGSSTTVTPAAPPSSADATTRMTATASAGFQGTLAIDPATGVITIDHARPLGTYTVTVTLVTACSGVATRSFNLTVNPIQPPFISAVATSQSSIQVSWPAVPGADHYLVYRRSAPGSMNFIGTTTQLSYTSSGHTANTTHLFQVKAVDSTDAVSNFSNLDLATTTMFTDDPLLPGTIVKGAHMLQLRTAVNAVRSAAGLSDYAFTDIFIPGEFVKSIHFAELRSALDAARSSIGVPAMAYPTAIAPGSLIRASAITEIRNGVK